MIRSATSPNLPAIDRLWAGQTGLGRLARMVALIAFGSALLWASAKIEIPFWPVPATLTSLVVVLIGAFYGMRLGAATVVAYLAEGLVGLPVFAGTPEKGIGFAYMAGPTGGYLLGFAAAVVVVGWLVERGWGRSIVSMAGAALLANMALYVFGLAWLTHLIGLEKAMAFGLMPFLAADAVKIMIAAGIVAATRPKS